MELIIAARRKGSVRWNAKGHVRLSRDFGADVSVLVTNVRGDGFQRYLRTHPPPQLLPPSPHAISGPQSA